MYNSGDRFLNINLSPSNSINHQKGNLYNHKGMKYQFSVNSSFDETKLGYISLKFNNRFVYETFINPISIKITEKPHKTSKFGHETQKVHMLIK